VKAVSLLLFFITNFVFAQTNADSIIINNKVREVRVVSAENNIACVSKYDRFGRLTYRLFDNFDGFPNLKSSIEWIYDSNGRKIKTISTHSSFTNPTIWIYEYDKKGNKLATKTVDGKPVFEYVYDDTGFLIKELAFDNYGVRRTSIYEKADDGQIIEKIYGRKKTIGRINITSFNNRGNIIKHESYDGNKVNALTTYTYEDNRCIQIKEYLGGGKNYTFNSQGQLIKAVQFQIANGMESKVKTEGFNYDGKGLLIKYIDKDSKVYRYEYDFYE
jgi:hypothetical protein